MPNTLHGKTLLMQTVFFPIVKCICTTCTMYFHLNRLIHFQYESSLRFMEQKEEVTHFQDITEANCVCPKLLNVFVAIVKCICQIF